MHVGCQMHTMSVTEALTCVYTLGHLWNVGSLNNPCHSHPTAALDLSQPQSGPSPFACFQIWQKQSPKYMTNWHSMSDEPPVWKRLR